MRKGCRLWLPERESNNLDHRTAFSFGLPPFFFLNRRNIIIAA